jgi:hypothetical protein
VRQIIDKVWIKLENEGIFTGGARIQGRIEVDIERRMKGETLTPSWLRDLALLSFYTSFQIE